MTVVQQKYIFELEGSAFAIFKIYPTEASDGKLRDWIELLGGVCLEAGEDDPYAIPILDLAWCKRTNLNVFRKRNSRDVFKSLFIYDCYTKDKLMDLNLYKIGDSILPEYNANLILQQKLSWDDVIAASSAILNVNLGESDDEPGTSFQRPQRLTRKTRSTPASKRTQDDLHGGSCTSSQSNQLCSNTNEEFNNKSKKVLLTSSTAVTTSAGSSSVQIQKNVLPNGDSTTRGRTIPTPDDDNDVTSQNRERSAESATSSSDDKSSRTSRRPSLRTNLPGISNETSVGRKKPSCPSLPELHIRGNKRVRSRGTSTDSSICSIRTESDSGSSKSRPRRKGAPYEYEESLTLLRWICAHEKHFMTGGNQMWIEMEDAGLLVGRTHQSLKEHFRKIISRNLDYFKCSEIDKRKFEKAKKVRDFGRRRPQDHAFVGGLVM